MEQNMFSPRLQNDVSNGKDTISMYLRNGAIGVLSAILGLLPIIFIPGIYVSIGFTKSVVVAVALAVAAIGLSLATLRSGVIKLYVPPALAFFWCAVLVSIASAFLSGDVSDALSGSAFEVHTAGFLLLMALVMTFSLAFSQAKTAIARVFMFLGISVFALQVYHLLRFVFGADFLSFGLFTTMTATPIGGFNDLAIVSGLAVLLTLIVAPQVSNSKFGKVGVTLFTLTSLTLLAVINFYAIWLILGFISLIALLYLVSRDTWLKGAVSGVAQPVSRFVLTLVGFVCLVSGVFVMSGDYISGYISNATGVTYLEVRPSAEATLNITQSIWKDNALLGVGPNLFENAWREYKDPIINQTVFWNTNFAAGSAYLLTLMATTGIAGTLMIVLFLGAFLYLGYRALFVATAKDSGWQMLTLMSVSTGIYLWLMTMLYVPGSAILIITALATGLSFATFSSSNQKGVVVNVAENKQYGLLLIAAVLVVIITTVLSSINFTKQYLSGVTYANAVRAYQENSNYNQADAQLSRAFDLNNQDIFLAERSQLRLIELQKLSSSENTALNQQLYTTLLSEGVGLIEQAINLDQNNPNNYRLLTAFYALLNPKDFEGIKERSLDVFARMQKLDPSNPIYHVEKAQYLALVGDLTSARESLKTAIGLKGDYTDALYMLSQLDIQEGKVDDAISVTTSIISIEPNNPTRYFQLGILLASAKKANEAISAFETAVGIDPGYANARYFLAIAYLEEGRKSDALIQLNLIKETNPDNQQLIDLIAQVESGNYQKATVDSMPVESTTSVTQDGDVTTTDQAPETDLVKTVNGVPAEGTTETAE